MAENRSSQDQMDTFRAAVLFWQIVLLFAGFWIVMPLLFHSAYYADVVELQIIAKEWVLATRKHPMLPAWILELLNIVTARSFAAPFIASALCTVLTLFSVWQLARQVLSERLALIGAVSMLPFYSLTVVSPTYNQNSVLMACWALTILMFYNAFHTNKKRWWIAAGIILGLGFHAKYTMLLLALAILFYSLCSARCRRFWKESGPWLALFIAWLIFLPHLIWLYQIGFWETFSYAHERQRYHEGMMSHVFYPIKFALSQLVSVLIAPLVLLVPSLGWIWKRQSPLLEKEKDAAQYLLCCMGIPFLLMAFFSAASANEMIFHYGYTLWFFLGVYLLLRFRRHESLARFRRTLSWTFLAVLVMAAVFLSQIFGSPYLKGKARLFLFPMHELGAECDRIWSSRFDVPIPYTSGQWEYASYAAYTMKDRPTVHFYWEGIDRNDALPTGTWSTDEQVNRCGGIILWDAKVLPESAVPEWVHRRFPRAEVLPEILELPYKTGAKVPPTRLGIAVIPPGSERSR